NSSLVFGDLVHQGLSHLAINTANAASCSRLATRARCRGLGGRYQCRRSCRPHAPCQGSSIRTSELPDDVGYAKYLTREKLVAHLKEVAASPDAIAGIKVSETWVAAERKFGMR